MVRGSCELRMTGWRSGMRQERKGGKRRDAELRNLPMKKRTSQHLYQGRGKRARGPDID